MKIRVILVKFVYIWGKLWRIRVILVKFVYIPLGISSAMAIIKMFSLGHLGGSVDWVLTFGFGSGS